MSINSLINQIKENNEDFEWYPTTESMIEKIVKYVRTKENNSYWGSVHSVLDIGCGNGSFLDRFEKLYVSSCNLEHDRIKKYGIEKSPTLIENLDDNIVVIGTDLFQQSLLDKKMDLIFCNPPYSLYEQFMIKILNECETKNLIFIVPERWRENKEIQKIIDYRELEYEIIDTDDFLNAERKARAKVEIVSFSYKRHGQENAFSKWFDNQFKINADKSTDYKEETEKKIDNELVTTSNVAEQLVQFYQDDMTKLYNNYKALESLDPNLFQELGIKIDNIKEGLKNKIKGLKTIYWNKLFRRYDKITRQLCNFTRDRLLSKLNNDNNIDFTIDNIFMITMWVIKHANSLYDEQLTDFFKRLCNKDSIKRYKSNKRFSDDDWRYIKNMENYKWYEFKEKNMKNVMLDYRIIYTGCSCTYRDSYAYGSRGDNSIVAFIQDCVIIAENLGFSIEKPEILLCEEYKRESCDFNIDKFEIKYTNGDTFMSVRTYQNMNVHCKFDERFMQKMNIEVSRLNGWVQDKKEAEEELNIKENVINESWSTNKQFVVTNPASLLESL